MSAKLTVILYIFVCLYAGLALTLLPWAHPLGIGDWGDNYFLLLAAKKIGWQGLPRVIASGWVRGAVTGIGLLNLWLASWEIVHLRRTLRAINASQSKRDSDAASAESATARVPNHER